MRRQQPPPRTIPARDLDRLFTVIKSGKMQKILELVSRYGHAILDQSKTPNGERPWEVAIKKGNFYAIIKELLQRRLLTKETATRIVKTYLIDRAEHATNHQLRRESENVKRAFQQLAGDPDLRETVPIAIAESISQQPFFKNIIFEHLKRGDIANVEHCLRQQPDLVNHTNEFGNLAHHAAWAEQSPGMITLLKRYGVNLNYHHDGRPPIIVALQSGNVVALNELYDQGADFGYRPEYLSIIETAIMAGLQAPDSDRPRYRCCVNFLRSKGLEPSYVNLVTLLIKAPAMSRELTKLRHVADVTGDNLDLRSLAFEGADHHCLSAVQFAANANNLEALKILIEEFGLSPNLRNSDTSTPLMIAIYRENWPIAKYLLDRGADLLDRVNGVQVIHLIMQIPLPIRISVIKEILRLPLPAPNRKTLLNMPGRLVIGADVNDPGSFYPELRTPIQMATVRGDLEVLELLLNDPDIETFVTPSLYLIALGQRQYKLVPVLKRYQVPVDAAALHSIKLLPLEVRKIFITEFTLDIESSFDIQRSKLETLYEDYQWALGYYLIIQDIDPQKAVRISSHVLATFDQFWQTYQDDYEALSTFLYYAYPNEAADMRFLIDLAKRFFYADDDPNCSVKAYLLEHAREFFQWYFQTTKEHFSSAPQTPQDEHTRPDTNTHTVPTGYSPISIPEKAMTGLAFLREIPGVDLETAKRMIAESKKRKDPTGSAAAAAGFWRTERAADSLERKSSWLDGALNTDDVRIKHIENSLNCYLLLSDEINLSGPYKEVLLAKSRWVFGPTNAIKRLTGGQRVELVINGRSILTHFSHEICSTNTADRILCCTISDPQTRSELLIPCHYCPGGLHHDRTDLPERIALSITLNNVAAQPH